VRPHPGQVESARNIRALLQGSYLARDVRSPKNRRREDLIQDRYALRSAPQWIGPQLEDLLLADRQISIELNSSCDNPLVDPATGDILYGCNFQAVAVTSAMEKTRLSLQMLGRLLSAQFTEMVDPWLSSGLPPNLVADDPSLSFGLKGVDISMAAYLAELAYLAHPMSSHIQPAEMHNQSVNSMAFASARQTMQAVDILSLMCACSLYGGCQALDLRVLHRTFLDRLGPAVALVTSRLFGTLLSSDELQSMDAALQREFRGSWQTTAKLDLQVRCQALVTSALPALADALAVAKVGADQLVAWKEEAFQVAFGTWKETWDSFCKQQHTDELLGIGSRVLYQTVRRDLGVPFHLGFVEHPTIKSAMLRGCDKRTIGEWVSIIYEAIKSGRLYSPLLDLMETQLKDRDGPNGYAVNGNGYH
jgi:phenylalanine ammonia-lyase